jgi:hypothetical protein
MKNIMALFLMPILIYTLTACSRNMPISRAAALAPQWTDEVGEETGLAVSPNQNSEIALTPIVVEYESDDLNTSVSSSDVSYITLDGDSISLDGGGATVEGNRITITSAGTYSISGRLDDGQIIVDTQDKETVVLALNGADITCNTGAPVYVRNAGKTVISLADGTENTVADGVSYVLEDAESDEPNAAIFSKDDLTINGAGSLVVNAAYNNGIASKDDLKVTGGSITVTAVNDGVKGKDSIAVKDGTITINAGGDGMQSTNDGDVEKGYIALEGGTLNITAGLDGIQAETRLLVSGGDITIRSGGGSANGSSSDNWGGQGQGDTSNASSDTDSAKGLKAGLDVTVTGGTISVDSADDAIHSNDSLTIDGGHILLASGDDGIHADATVQINGGDLSITKSYEGIESAIITVNEGNVRVIAADDGFNTAGGNDGSSINGRPGQNQFSASSNYHLYINGGYIFIDATGDGIDSNGPVDMTGGVVLVNGPTENMNGALDYTGAFNISGGFLVAVGSSGMAQAPSASSTQYSMLVNFTSVQTAGTMVHLEAEDGEDVLTFAPTKAYQSVVFSSPDLENGVSYVVYTGGNATGTAVDGLYSGGTYTAGTEITR